MLLILPTLGTLRGCPKRSTSSPCSSFTRDQLAELLPDPEVVADLLLTLQRAMAGALALTALLYQGGMTFYYLRSAPAARAVFAEPPVLVSTPPIRR